MSFCVFIFGGVAASSPVLSDRRVLVPFLFSDAFSTVFFGVEVPSFFPLMPRVASCPRSFFLSSVMKAGFFCRSALACCLPLGTLLEEFSRVSVSSGDVPCCIPGRFCLESQVVIFSLSFWSCFFSFCLWKPPHVLSLFYSISVVFFLFPPLPVHSSYATCPPSQFCPPLTFSPSPGLFSPYTPFFSLCSPFHQSLSGLLTSLLVPPPLLTPSPRQDIPGLPYGGLWVILRHSPLFKAFRPFLGFESPPMDLPFSLLALGTRSLFDPQLLRFERFPTPKFSRITAPFLLAFLPVSFFGVSPTHSEGVSDVFVPPFVVTSTRTLQVR